MRIFITGATGFIGFAVAAELARAGHTVYGLARTPEKGKRLAAAEVLPVEGDMDRPESYRDAARESQVLIHCAAEPSPRFMDLDRRTTAALLEAAKATGRSRLFVYTSGVWVYGNSGTRRVDEATALDTPAMVAPRVETERLVLGHTSGALRTLVLRPGCVYGGSGSLTAAWFDSAEKEGAARIVGDGQFRWAMVHVSDLAVAYRLAVESTMAGEIFNVTDRSRFTVFECARAASEVVNGAGKVVTTPIEEAVKTMGPLVTGLTLDQHVDSSKAMRLLAWNPRHSGFVDGVERYYAAWKASR